jgi:hypothetical protein
MITSFPLDSGRLNAQYLIVALLEGAFTSNEHKLVRWWRLPKPSGPFLPVDHWDLSSIKPND